MRMKPLSLLVVSVSCAFACARARVGEVWEGVVIMNNLSNTHGRTRVQLLNLGKSLLKRSMTSKRDKR